MAEKLFTNALSFNSNENKIEIVERKIYNLGISSARITNACLMAIVKECKEGKSSSVEVKYNNQKPQVIDIIAPKNGDKISINITEELNCLIKFAFRYSGNPEHDDKISILFDTNIVLEKIDLYVEYIPEQIMHENSAYVDYDVRKAGNGKINLATGALRFTHQCGNEVALVYNDGQTEKRSTTVYDVEGKKTKFHHGVGKGFKLNLEQFLLKRKGTENQSVYTYVDGEGNYHEFSEKYYYISNDIDGTEQKIFVPKSKVQVDLNGHLKYVVGEHDEKKILIERKTTNGLCLEQDYADFKGAKYLEQRQQEQIDLEENVDALKRQLKQYVIVDKNTGNKLASGGVLKDMFTSTDDLFVNAYESFLNALNKGATRKLQNSRIRKLKSGRLLLTESEAIQYQSLLMQQTVKSDILTANLTVESSYDPKEPYSDSKIKNPVFQTYNYNKTLIGLRNLVKDLRKDYATLMRKKSYPYINYSCTYDTNLYKGTNLNSITANIVANSIHGIMGDHEMTKHDMGEHYQYEAYVDYLNDHSYHNDNCCINISRITGCGNGCNLNSFIEQNESPDNLTINIGHIEGKYCDLKLELERINDHLDSYYRGESDNKIKPMKVRQKVVEQRLRLFQQEFSDRTDKLQANINKFETEINDFVEKLQGELINRQICMLLENAQNNKSDLEKYFKQYYNNQHKLVQMKWQLPTYFVTGNDDVTMGFNKDGYLVALFDNYENQTAIIYEKGRISSVQDTDNNIISFEYGNGKRIKKIVTSDGKAYHLFYDKDKEEKKGLLTNIIDGNGEETKLGYYNYGFLNSVEDNSGFGIKFVYDEYGRVKKVKQTSKIKYITDNGVELAESMQDKTLAEINYHDSHLTTSVTDEVGLVKTYNFDIVGKVVTMYEGQYSDPEETTKAKSFEYVDNKKSFTISDNVSATNLIAEKDRKFALQGTKDNKPCRAFKSIDVPLSVFKSNVTDYVFSVWAKADSAYVDSDRSSQYNNTAIDKTYGISADENKKNRKFEVRAEITYEDDSPASFVAGFDWLNINWQYLAMPIEVRQGKKVKKCVITLDYSFNVGEASFDCLSLREGTWNYSEFDDEGKQTYSEDSASRTNTKYFYDDNDKLVKTELTDTDGNIFTSTREYNDKGSLVRSISYNGLVEETVYDGKGRAVKKITYNIDDPTSKFYEESKLDDKGVVTADIDESGEYDSVTYSYLNGEVAVQTDGKGNKTAFGYKNGDLVSISGSTDGEESVNTMHSTADLLTKVGNGETAYNFEYDCWGRTACVKIAGKNFITKQYSGNLQSTTAYADGYSTFTESDVYGNTVKQSISYNDKIIGNLTNTYNAETGKLTESAVDNGKNSVYNIKYSYDFKGNVLTEERSGLYPLKKEFGYTVDNDLKTTTYTAGDQKLTYTYEKEKTPDKRNLKVTLPFAVEQNFAYDGLGRTREISLGKNLVKDIYYQKFGDHATNRVSTVWFGVNGIRKDSTKYSYDKAGNITSITENGKLVARYSYDGLNRLIREDNAHFGTFIYCYDAAGNILSKTAYAYTLNDTLGEIKAENVYSYNQQGWKDQLLSCNNLNCKYDIIGNPTVYKGRNLTWQNSRLISYGIDKKKATYSYDFNGVRTSKTATDGKQTLDCKYIYDGNNLIAEQRNGKWIYYIYGVDGIAGFNYQNTTYLYRKNIQGDITHIYRKDNDTLTLVAQYAYDAYGNTEILSEIDNIGSLNPFRYRGYYFDIDTKLYYLISRYYDPETGRFISADSIDYLDPETLGGLNLYAYCCNNPVMAIDPEGTKLKWWQKLLIALGGIVIIAALAVATVVTGGAAAGLVGAIAAGALKGALIGAAIGAAFGAGIGYAVGGIDGLWTGLAIGFTAGAFVGAIVGGTIGGMTYSPLKAASNAAFKAKPAKYFNINKHLNSAGGRHSKFLSDSIDDIVSIAQNGLKSQNILIKSNGASKSWKFIVDAGQVIGTKGQTAIRVIVGYGGKIWTMFPVFL